MRARAYAGWIVLMLVEVHHVCKVHRADAGAASCVSKTVQSVGAIPLGSDYTGFDKAKAFSWLTMHASAAAGI